MLPSEPTVALIICTRNRPGLLRQALAAASACNPPPDVILVSDDSDVHLSDASAIVCREFADVVYIAGSRRGLAANRNWALAHLQHLQMTNRVVFVDDDACLDRAFFQHVKRLSRAPDSRLTIFAGWEQNSSSRVTPGDPTFLGHQEKPLRTWESARSIVINAAAFPTSLFETCSFFEELRYSYEEIDIVSQALKIGYSVTFDPELRCIHDAYQVDTGYRQELFERSRIIASHRRHMWLGKRGAATLHSVVAPIHLAAYAWRNHRPRSIRKSLNQLAIGVNAIRTARQSVRQVFTPAFDRAIQSGELQLSVVVPTYRRRHSLEATLRGLAAQQRKPDEVVIVARTDDLSTQEYLAAANLRMTVKRVDVDRPGQIASLNVGLAAVSGNVIAIIDDDVVPQTDWSERILDHFAANPRLGAVGGRDRVHQPNGTVAEPTGGRVGGVTWFGRSIGNHHLGSPPAQRVQYLKGANIAVCRDAVAGLTFDERLRGRGAQVHNDMLFSLLVGRRGWDVVYDPEILVDHYPAVRHDADQRGEFNPEALQAESHNLIIAFASGLPLRQSAPAIVYSLLVGYRYAPGPLVLLWLLCTSPHRRVALARAVAATRGRLIAFRTITSGARKRAA
jgi:glycosyltransferase involved in cell wall biosynthesis